MSSTPVLIVGAGPTGLLMACELARHGIDFRIIDKNPEQTLTNNATWIQTLTLEMFDEMGIIDPFLRAGHGCRSINLYTQGKSFAKISFDQLDSLYQYVLMLPQSETERILKSRLEELNRVVDRPLELVGVIQVGNRVEAALRHTDGTIETVLCDWLIACDGANSTVREKCNIFFPGEDLTEQFVVADAQMDSFLHPNELHVFFDKGTVFATLPLGSSKYRLGTNLHLSYPRKLYTEKEVKEIVIDRACGNYNVESVSWISPFWIHSKCAETMRHGNIFLAGDAAHVHSPAGGQGMNTGLQDAYNLAWKLALVVKGEADVSLLDTYEKERLPIIKQIVARTERFTRLATTENSFLIYLRNLVYKLIHGRFGASKRFTMRLTQLDSQYEKSSIIDYHLTVSSKSPKPGMRSPDVKLAEGKRLHQYLRHPQHHVLLFMGLQPSDDDKQSIWELQDWLNEQYPETVKSYVIAKEKLEEVEDVIVDADGVIHKKYAVKKPAVYVIRPDNYIACCTNNPEINTLKKLFSRYLHERRVD